MKIVQLVFHLGSGGAEKFVVDLSNELARQGHEVTLIMLRNKDEARFNLNCRFVADNVKLQSLNIPEGFCFKYIPIVERAVLDENPDVVHAHLNILPYIMRLMFCHKNIRFIHTIHNLAQVENPSAIQMHICKWFYRNKYVIPVTISDICDQSFRDYYRLDCSVKINNGRSVPEKSENYAKIVDELSKLPRPLFVHVARRSKEKNQELLLRAFAKLDKPYTLLILGGGYDEDSAIKNLASDNVHFLGTVPNVGDYLYCADAFCLSSLVEGMPISLIEAMACGLPSICTPAGGIPNMIVQSKTGFVSNDFSLDAYAAALKLFFDYEFDGKLIKDTYRARYSIRTCAHNYLKLYHSSITE